MVTWQKAASKGLSNADRVAKLATVHEVRDEIMEKMILPRVLEAAAEYKPEPFDEATGPMEPMAACGHKADGPEGDPECNACFEASTKRLGEVVATIDANRREIELRGRAIARGFRRAVPFNAASARVQIDGENHYDPASCEMVAASDVDAHNEREVPCVYIDAYPEVLETLCDTTRVLEAALAVCTDDSIRARISDQIASNVQVMGLARR